MQDLKPAKGARKPKRRKGRGMGSGRGKTCGRGTKGQKSRSGARRVLGFEGGQMPLIRRIPKVGFMSRNKIKYSIVNLDKLNVFEQGSNVTPALLKDRGVIKTKKRPVKILGNGQIKKGLDVSANAFSDSAKSAIEKAGGKAKVIN